MTQALPCPSDSRRHDLDALRGIAMLLGIVLHGAMSFIPGIGPAWPVHDVQANGLFGLLLAGIHGFRMPLFFLISGFFTAMLFRKRGLPSLAWQRFKRIFIPFVIGVFTIIPSTWIVAGAIQARDNAAKAAAASDDEAADARAITDAAAINDTETLQELIDRGVSLSLTNDNGATPLHVAIFFGHVESAELLLDAGADRQALSDDGQRPEDLLNVSWGITSYIAGMAGIEVDRQTLMQGRAKIAERMEVPFTLSTDGQQESVVAQVIGGLMMFPLFGHLWFLWFLCWLVAGFFLCVAMGNATKMPGLPRWMVVSPLRYAWLIPLTMIPQAFMGTDGLGFGPATSLGLLPMPQVLLYYSIFFAFGAFYYDAADRDVTLGSRWWITLPVALLIVFPIGLAFSREVSGWGRLVSIATQATYAWLCTFGMMGLFRRVFAKESKTLRYLSDSSYWLYLVHIPLIFIVQYWVRDWQVSALVKFPVVCLVTSGSLLISYHLFVRYTPIGTLLNGPRRRGNTEIAPATPALASHQSG